MSPPQYFTSSQRPAQYKTYNEDRLRRAYTAVMEDKISIRQAAVEYNVPRSTLGDRVRGRVLSGAVSGRQPYLSRGEEDELVCFIIRSGDIGFPRGRKEVIALVQRVCDSNGLNVTVTHGWWERFCFRHRNISLRVAAPLSQARMKGTDAEVLHAYFDELEATLVENELDDKPCQVFNMDESGMRLSPAPPKVLCKKGTKSLNWTTGGDKSQITVVGCVSAGGYCLPPMVIYDRKTLHQDMSKGKVAGTMYGLSSKGWIDQELFDSWFKHHFLWYVPPQRPMLLLMDGHSSHYCPQTIHFAAKEKVILFTLPPNTTQAALAP